MATAPILQPTLWRTCRVLANHTRLEILDLLAHDRPQPVSVVAARLGLTLPVASQALRALEARGLLACRRNGLKVEYRLGAATNADSRPALVVPLRAMLQHDLVSREKIFKLATAFTHPRRIELFQLVHTEPRTLVQLRSFAQMSGRALARHLRKLEARGFIICLTGKYSAVEHPEALGRMLAQMAAGQ